MRFFHMADLHLGKMVNGFSMLPDQAHILQEVLALMQQHRPDALVLAGDIYDRPTPPVEAVRLYDDFLTKAAALSISVLVVAGNHDSPERLGFAGQLLQQSAIHSYGPFSGAARVVTLEGEGGAVDFHLLPFLRPASVRRFFPEETVESYQDAMRLALGATPLHTGRPSVLVAHQFVTAGGGAPQRCDSETRSLGGLDEVDAGLFAPFAYVALGHIHGPQAMGQAAIRYAGSPLKYSFSERGQQKSITLVEITASSMHTCLLPLTPLRDMREIAGPIEELLTPLIIHQQNPEDYLRVVLCDELEVPDAMGKLRHAYPNVMEVAYENTRSRARPQLDTLPELRKLPANELFRRFYSEQNGRPPSAAQEKWLENLLGDKEALPL